MRFLIQCAGWLLLLSGLLPNAYATTAGSVLSGQPDTSVRSVGRLRQELDSLFSDTAFSNASFGVAIQSMKTGEYLYSLNDTKSLIPASNMKLFTTAEALELLGPEFRYITPLVTTGSITEEKEGNYTIKVLKGDLIVRGSGDPTFGLDTDRSAHIPGWLRKIEGRFVGDDSYFSSEHYPLGWSAEDLSYYYAPPISALNFDENQETIDVYSGDNIGASVDWNPSEDLDFTLEVVNNATVTTEIASTIDVARRVGTDTVMIQGHMPPDTTITQSVSIENPTYHAVDVMTGVLRERGGIVTKEPQTVSDGKLVNIYSKAHIVSVDTSLPLSDLVQHMNKTSDNFYAECLFRTVAKVIGDEGSWTRGIEVMRKYLATIGIDTAYVQFTDGSGLSRMDLVTAEDIVKLLSVWYPKDVKDSKDGKNDLSNPSRPLSPLDISEQAFFNSLPIMGIDGTLENRLKGTPAQGNVHAKTGSMTGVRSISGYLTTRDGEPIAFSILANNYTCPGTEIGALENKIILALVNFSRE